MAVNPSVEDSDGFQGNQCFNSLNGVHLPGVLPEYNSRFIFGPGVYTQSLHSSPSSCHLVSGNFSHEELRNSRDTAGYALFSLIGHLFKDRAGLSGRVF